MATINESLMKKTKKDLVEIILRKDDVETSLRKEIADSKLDLDKAKEIISKKECEIQNITNSKSNKISYIAELESNNEHLQYIINDKDNKINTLKETIGILQNENKRLDKECNKSNAISIGIFIVACVFAVAFIVNIVI